MKSPLNQFYLYFLIYLGAASQVDVVVLRIYRICIINIRKKWLICCCEGTSIDCFYVAKNYQPKIKDILKTTKAKDFVSFGNFNLLLVPFWVCRISFQQKVLYFDILFRRFNSKREKIKVEKEKENHYTVHRKVSLFNEAYSDISISFLILIWFYFRILITRLFHFLCYRIRRLPLISFA